MRNIWALARNFLSSGLSTVFNFFSTDFAPRSTSISCKGSRLFPSNFKFMSLKVFVEVFLLTLALANLCKISTIKSFSFWNKNGARGFSDRSRAKNGSMSLITTRQSSYWSFPVHKENNSRSKGNLSLWRGNFFSLLYCLKKTKSLFPTSSNRSITLPFLSHLQPTYFNGKTSFTLLYSFLHSILFTDR